MIINNYTLVFIFFLLFILKGVFIYNAQTFWRKILLLGFYCGLFIYSGIGVFYKEVNNIYIIYYITFFLLFSFSFLIFTYLFSQINNKVSYYFSNFFRINSNKLWKFIIFIYIIINLFISNF